uniref:Uncharacterized protein n=1 Tax=Arundo donax TaxID=35708 RepID=A0A0A9N4U1_ARUDO
MDMRHDKHLNKFKHFSTKNIIVHLLHMLPLHIPIITYDKCIGTIFGSAVT